MNRDIIIYLHSLGISNNTLLYLVENLDNLIEVFEDCNKQIFLNGIHYTQRKKISKINIKDYNEYITNLKQNNKFKIITIYDDEYPIILKHINDKPCVIYINGHFNFNDEIGVAVVGSRDITNYGAYVTKIIVEELSKHNIPIISGMAKGIDRVAHSISIANNNSTIAVLGCGVDNIYPKENRDLYNIIPNTGAVMSEFPLGCEPYRYNFPMRNRIISGLSLATIVIEANQKSGSLITASHAAMQGREVFALPGRITDLRSIGTNSLIKDGARPINDINQLTLDIINIKERFRMN